MSVYVWTNDPDDPCAYCVAWEEDEDDVMGEHARPYLPSGYVDRVYKGAHSECMRGVALYIEESARDR